MWSREIRGAFGGEVEWKCLEHPGEWRRQLAKDGGRFATGQNSAVMFAFPPRGTLWPLFKGHD